MKHSKISPSGMHRIIQCPGSLKLCEGLPDIESDAAREGIAAAWIIEQLFAEKNIDEGIAPNEFEVDQAMIDHAESYLKTVLKYGTPMIEQAVDCSIIVPDCFGTPDAYIINRDKKIVEIFDYKYGFIPVEVEENWQLITYALGLKYWLKLGSDWGYRLHVYQPRAFHSDGIHRTWNVDSFVLNERLFDIQDAIASDFLKTGPACTYCKAAGICPKLKEETDMICESEENQQYETAEHLTPKQESDDLLRLENASKLIKARMLGLTQSITTGIQTGKTGYRHHLVQKMGREHWTIGVDQIKALGILYGKILVKETPITPKQAITAKIPADVVRINSKTESTGYELQLVDEKNLAKLFDQTVK